jgi:AcrR family transcriptional regulator
MFKTKADATRAHIFKTALGLFRKKGFDATTMRDIAAEADVALGSAYYYFPSKEAIVAGYYDHVQAEHRRRSIEILAETSYLKARLVGITEAKLDILKDDRKLLAALFRYGGDPEHPLSWFGPETRRHRESCMRTFAEALEPEQLPAEVADIAPLGLWALDMGILLYFLYDTSSGQQRTRKLAAGAMDLVVRVRQFVNFPLLRPMRRHVIAMLREAGLIPDMKAILSPQPVEAEAQAFAKF